jgi:pimeloyl-ACP methyl ester carboxylesterase
LLPKPNVSAVARGQRVHILEADEARWLIHRSLLSLLLLCVSSRFFNPGKWRVILLDQRGCGASTPRGCLVDNTTEHLISDMEALRAKLGIEEWVLFGGSWGVTLSLAYAQRHPLRTAGMILRGVCLMRRQEIDFMFRGGAGMLYPRVSLYLHAAFITGLGPEASRQSCPGYSPGTCPTPILLRAGICRLSCPSYTLRALT